MKIPAVYIVASSKNGTLYTGVTSDLVRRIYQHKNGLMDGFSKRYGCKILAFFEVYDDMYSAISREKQIKAGSRRKKIDLIEKQNPAWQDLYDTIA